MTVRVLLIGFFLLFGCNQTMTLSNTSRPFPLETFHELENPDRIDLDSLFASRYLLVGYYTELDCKTCVDEELVNMRDLARELEGKLSTLLVIRMPTQPVEVNPYLRTTRRLTANLLPILLERAPGEAGLGDHIVFHLVDLRNQNTLITYQPETLERHWPQFRERIKAKLIQ